MNTRKRPFGDTAQVRLFDLTKYLQGSGWVQQPSRSARWVSYSLKESDVEGIELILPSDEAYSDTYARIRDAVGALSQIEERDEQTVVDDILCVNSDSITFRLSVAEKIDSLPISDATRHIKAIRNLILYGYCSELAPRSHFEAPLPAALEMIQDFHFCHTFRGSFGFEIKNSVTRAGETPDLFSAPMQRKVVERVARGISLLKKAVLADDPSILIESYELALNARMCDSLTSVALDGRVSFQIDVAWATILEPSRDVESFDAYTISEAEVSVLTFASEKLKIIQPRPDQILGQVVNLHCVADPTEGSARRIVAVRVNHHLHGPIEVRMSLGPEQYLLALEAHSKGLKLSAHGQLQRRGSSWTLDAISVLKVADGANSALQPTGPPSGGPGG